MNMKKKKENNREKAKEYVFMNDVNRERER